MSLSFDFRNFTMREKFSLTDVLPTRTSAQHIHIYVYKVFFNSFRFVLIVKYESLYQIMLITY